MGLDSIFSTGLSGLQAAQAGLKVVSQNITNVNTTGYARAELNLTPTQLGAAGGGVSVQSITRAANEFLAAAALNAASAQSSASVRATYLNQAQTAFGDPNSSASLFGSLNSVFSNLTTLAANSTNTLTRSAAIGSIKDFLSSLSSVSGQLSQLSANTDATLGQQAQSVTTLLSQIASLNTQIASTTANGGDATSAQNAQSQLIDQLSSYVDVKVTQRDDGGVTVRTGAGALLVGASAAKVVYTPVTSSDPSAGSLNLVDSNGTTTSLGGLITSGSIAGLLQVRDQDLPQLQQSLGALAGATADTLNAISNNSTAVPAPSTLTGRDTGLVSTDRLGFTGSTTIAVTDSSGKLLHTIAVNFSNGTLSVDGGASSSFGGANATVAQFVSGLNTALGSSGTASFTNGALTISASGGNGIVVQQDATTPSSRGGRGFSQFFGLNDLITRSQPSFYDTGFSASDANGLNSGGAISFAIVDSSGRTVATRTVAATGTTWADQIAALNASGTGLGSYGSFALSATGALTLTTADGYTVKVTSDTTTRGNTGLSMSALFGLDAQSTAGRAADMSVSSAIAANPALLQVAQPDLTQALGAQVLETGDNSGLLALAAAANTKVAFAAVGAMSAQTVTLSSYASTLGGVAGQIASAAQTAQTNAATVASAASAQRSSAEGVQLDDELVKMTQYQQSYSAASRLIQAAKDMYDVLLAIK